MTEKVAKRSRRWCSTPVRQWLVSRRQQNSSLAPSLLRRTCCGYLGCARLRQVVQRRLRRAPEGYEKNWHSLPPQKISSRFPAARSQRKRATSEARRPAASRFVRRMESQKFFASGCFLSPLSFASKESGKYLTRLLHIMRPYIRRTIFRCQ